MFRKFLIYISNCCENILMNRLCFLYLRFVNGQNYDESYKNRIGIYMNNMLTAEPMIKRQLKAIDIRYQGCRYKFVLGPNLEISDKD